MFTLTLHFCPKELKALNLNYHIALIFFCFKHTITWERKVSKNLGSSSTDLMKHYFHESLVQFPKGYFSIPKPPLYLCLGAQIWQPQNCLEWINFLWLQFCLWSANKSQELLYAKYFSAKHFTPRQIRNHHSAITYRIWICSNTFH